MTVRSEMEVRFKEALAPFTTFGIGGPAEVLYFPRRAEDLRRVFMIHRGAGEEPIFLGGGSNVLVSDEGVAEPVVIMRQGFDVLEWEESGPDRVMIRVGAGVASAALVNRAGERGWADLTFLAGIPGTVGGAAVMNAGYGQKAMADVLVSLTVMNRDGQAVRLERDDLDYGYRRLSLAKGAVVVEAELLSGLADPEAVAGEIRESREKRGRTQPKGARSAGSFFKNPENDFAGRLIEAAGLKGRAYGGAQVSPVHANFIVNNGSATAGEVLTLAQQVRDEVEARFKVRLEPEVRFVGRGGERWPWMGS